MDASLVGRCREIGIERNRANEMTAGRPVAVRFEEALDSAEERRREVTTALRARRVNLPLRLWAQQAHFTTPASDGTMARKAIEEGTAPMTRILERFDVTPAQLAHSLGTDESRVTELLDRPRRAPVVMLDGEDAQAPDDATARLGIHTAVGLFTEARWSDGRDRTLRFFRPPGFGLQASVRDLYSLLWALAEHSQDDVLALDGIVFPKIEHPEEVDLLLEVLGGAERALGIRDGSIRVAVLIESGWAAARLGEIALRVGERLCSMILGLADFSADVGLPTIRNDHPVADWLRAELVNVAGAVGVPAIDAMTLAYPVRDASLNPAVNRERFLDRMVQVFQDAISARDLGMHGKWVGHPAQLFAVILAFEASFEEALLETEAAKLVAYDDVVRQEHRGAAIIDGSMADRATDRHARSLLRRATALGRFDPARALVIGVISDAELVEMQSPGTAPGDALP